MAPPLRLLIPAIALVTALFVVYSLLVQSTPKPTVPSKVNNEEFPSFNDEEIESEQDEKFEKKPGDRKKPDGAGFHRTNTTTLKGTPNFLFILLDEMGWTDAGYLGSKYYETPNIDRLAAQGISFTNAYANSHVCAPSRASLLSGQYGPRHNVFTIGTETAPHAGDVSHRKLMPAKSNRYLPLETVTIAEALKAGGYKTASIGKWHLGHKNDGRDAAAQGFDIDLGGRDTGSTDSHFWPYGLPSLDTGGKAGEYLTDRMTNEAMAFIDRVKGDPWFIYLSYYAVHTPMQAPDNLVHKYTSKKGDSRHNNAVYAGMIESVDGNLGRLLQKLEAEDLAKDTVIVFFSDNGGLNGITRNDPLRGGKGVLYEGGVREPLIVYWKDKIRPGVVSEVPVMGTDFYPTFLELARIKPPAGHVLDGKSLVPLLFEESNHDLKERPLFWHFPNYMVAGYMGFGGIWAQTPSGSVRLGDWKLIEFFEDGSLELYNLKDDLGEKHNLVAKFPAKAKELQQLMIEWREDTKAPVPNVTNPAWDHQTRKLSI